jgi:hypothetical protein
VLPATGVEVVRLEVAVSEKGTRPRTGLRREDFVVLEDGRPQPIVQFQAFARSEAAVPAAAPTPARAEAEAEEADDRLPARYVVLAIDDVHMEFDSLVRARKARVVLAEAVYNSRLTLETLESLCRGLSGLTGRKTLFLVSDGFITGISAGSGSSFDMRRIADAGTRAGVVVYALDTRGLVATPPTLQASSPLKIGTASVGNIESMARRTEEATRAALHAIAADTGGFLVEDSRPRLRAHEHDATAGSAGSRCSCPTCGA